MPTNVTVIRDGGIRARGHRDGDAIVYDWGFTGAGVDQGQRSFVLLDTGFQVNQPVIFPERQRGRWYGGLVRVLDLEEYAGMDGSRRTQLFLDRHLNRRHDTRRDSWPGFPPRAVAALAGQGRGRT